jgi:hypothetical protein
MKILRSPLMTFGLLFSLLANPLISSADQDLNELIGRWTSVEFKGDREMDPATHSIRLSIREHGNVEILTKSKHHGQQAFDTSYGRIDGDHLLYDNGHSAEIRQHGDQLELFDGHQPGKSTVFHRARHH